MLRRAIAPALLLAALAAPVHADPLPAAVTHGSVKVYVQHFRCTLYDYALTGSFQIAARSWQGTLHVGTCLFAGDTKLPTQAPLTVDDTSSYGRVAGTCLTNLVTSADFSAEAPDPLAFACRLSLNGSAALPVAFEVKTHATSNPDHEFYLEKVGSFYGA